MTESLKRRLEQLESRADDGLGSIACFEIRDGQFIHSATGKAYTREEYSALVSAHPSTIFLTAATDYPDHPDLTPEDLLRENEACRRARAVGVEFDPVTCDDPTVRASAEKRRVYNDEIRRREEAGREGREELLSAFGRGPVFEQRETDAGAGIESKSMSI